MTPVEEARTELYGLAPEAFTERRNEIVKARRKTGEKEVAAVVAAMRKPAVQLWAVNHLARERTLAVTRLLSAAANLAEAQELALAGEEGAGARLRQDSGEYQRSLDLAVREAASLLRDAGRGASEETARRVREILAGAALGDDGVRGALAAGALAEEPVGPGLAAFRFGIGGDAAPRIEAQRKAPSARAPKPTVAAVTRPQAEAASAPREEPSSLAADDRRARHRQRLEARRDAETAATTVKRLTEVARRARRRASVAAAAAASAEDEAGEAEARHETAVEEEERARTHYESLQNTE